MMRSEGLGRDGFIQGLAGCSLISMGDLKWGVTRRDLYDLGFEGNLLAIMWRMKSVKIVQKMYGIITIINSQTISTLKEGHIIRHSQKLTCKGTSHVAFFSLAELFQEIQISPPKCQEMPPK